MPCSETRFASGKKRSLSSNEVGILEHPFFLFFHGAAGKSNQPVSRGVVFRVAMAHVGGRVAVTKGVPERRNVHERPHRILVADAVWFDLPVPHVVVLSSVGVRSSQMLLGRFVCARDP